MRRMIVVELEGAFWYDQARLGSNQHEGASSRKGATMSVIPSRRLTLLLCLVTLGSGLLLSSPAGAQIDPPTTVTNTYPVNGHEYALFEVYDYYEARAIATAMNGYLASLPDDAERQWAADAFPVTTPYIGLTSEAMPGTFEWESGEALGTTDWGLNEPIPSAAPRYVRGIQNWQTGTANSAIFGLFEFEFGVINDVPTIETTLTGSSVEVTWTAPAGTTATVIRNGLVVGTAVAPATNLFEIPPPGLVEYAVVLDTPAGVLLPGRSAIVVPDPAVRLYLLDETVIRPATTTAALYLDQGVGPGQGVSAGICIDYSEVAVSDVELGNIFDTLLPVPSFFELNPFYSNGIGIGIVYDLFGVTTLPVGAAYELVTFEVESLTTGTVTTEFRPCDEIGSPNISSAVVVNGSSIPPLLISGFITFTDIFFLRGDCNFDGSVDLADPLFLGLRLFDATVNDYPCREACEANGDGAVNIADMVWILGYLFAGGPAPVAPFPDCGPDPEPETAFDCELGTACP